MASSSPIAKVSRPVPTGFFPRKRLYRLLDRSRKSPLIWITGPPGCGKTTLVSSYIESRRLPCLWYKVDEGDADLATFFYYLGLAAKKAAPRSKKRLPLLTPDRLPGLTVFAHRYFESLSAMLPVPCLVVLDDCHHMKETPLFFETLREGISRLSPGIVSVLVSRSDPHPSFSRERANSLMEVFGWEELRLTPEETAGIVRIRRKGKSPPGLAKDLFEQTDGWAAGLVLLLESEGKGRVKPRSIGKQVPSEFIDYFGSEVFRRLDDERRHFLMKTAILPRMTASMAEKLTGVEEAGSILSEMNRHNQFTKKYLQREPVYEYHDLFREFLLKHAEDSFSGVELTGIRTGAAALLEEAGYFEDAAGLYRQTGDINAFVRLILTHAHTLVTLGRIQTLLGWLGYLPKEVVDNEPWLLYWNGACILFISPAKSLDCFKEALAKFEEKREASGAFLAWAGAVDSILTGMHSFLPVDEWISLLPTLLEKFGELPPGEIGDRVTIGMFKALSFRQESRDELAAWTARALSVARESIDVSQKIYISVVYFYCHQAVKGSYHDAEMSLASLRKSIRRLDTTPWMRIWVDYIEVVLSLYQAMPERCMRVVEEALAFAETSGFQVVDPLFLGYGALAALNLGDTGTASRYLRHMETTLGSTGALVSSLYHAIVGMEALHRQELGKAVFHSNACLREIKEAGNATDFPAAHLLVAHVHHALCEDVKADKHLEIGRRIGFEIDSPHALWLSALTEAYFHMTQNEDASMIAPLKEGMRIGRERGFYGMLLWLPKFCGAIAARALAEGIEVDYARELIRRQNLHPDPAISDLEAWPWPVKVYTFGRFGILVKDSPIEFGRKVQQRPLSLLKALVALGGREVSEARLSELLWPEADGDLAHHSLTVALSRLRKLLGRDEAVVLRESRLSLSDHHCWVDAWAFERFYEQSEKARKEGRAEEAVRLLGKAMGLYRGSFLPFEEMGWAVSPREKLRKRFLEAVGHLGRFHEESEQWEEAASCYGRGLNVDELAEELYLRLMLCHLRRGQHAEALSVYRRCRKTLLSVLGVNPSAETEAIATSIRRSVG